MDHSVQVDVARTENAVHANMELEFQRNKERFAFLKWGSSAFDNMLGVPPGSGIVHQVKTFCIFHLTPALNFFLYQMFLYSSRVHTLDICLILSWLNAPLKFSFWVMLT